MRTTVTLMCLLVVATPTHAQPKDIDPDELKPGLIATYGGVHRLEPTVAVRLAAGESPHPRVDADKFEWAGYLNLFRRGAYTFTAPAQGTFALKLDGKDVPLGKPVELEAGPRRFEATFVRPDGPASLELRWSGPNFRDEPLPADAVAHLPAERPKAFAADALADHGRLLFEEHSCIRCHSGDAAFTKSITDRAAPILTKVGERVHPAFLYAWLADPKKYRPDTQMPKLFADDENGLAEAYAVAKFLTTLGGPMQPAPKPKNPQELIKSAVNGQKLFTTTGCAACHGTNDAKADPAAPLTAFVHARQYALTSVGIKTRPDLLAGFLQNPLATHPGGRMPSSNLDGQASNDIANYLCSSGDPNWPRDLPDAPAGTLRDQLWQALPRDQIQDTSYAVGNDKFRWEQLGRRLTTSKGCVNCHSIDAGGMLMKKLDTFPALAKVDASKGCLAAKPGAAPDFGLKPFPREALAAFVGTIPKSANAPAPTFHARQALSRFNCLNCHNRDGEGGLSTELMASMSKLEKAENADAVTPPTLTGVGHKMRTPWMKAVLTQAGRARPWMGLRMPQYGEANVGHLVHGLATVEGIAPDDAVAEVKLSPAKIEAGRHLIGKGGFGCISCHDIAGIENTGTRGPDLSTQNQRVRYEWYRRWLEQPLRMAPGTRMPQVFIKGRSAVDNVMGGDGDAQAEAMWAYLSLGQNLPLPAGLEPPKGRTIQVVSRPEILRTFMPDAGNKAIAVGYPGGMSVVFDAQRCRLAYAWAGNFLDASPVWDNRGGAPAKVLGVRYWTSPTGNPWAISGSREPPDFATRLKDPAFGADLPDGQLFQGPFGVHFDGYSLDVKGYPSFKYRIDGAAGVTLNVVERPEPVRSEVATGVLRHFTLESPAKEVPWLVVGDTAGEPRVLDANGTTVPLPLRDGFAEQPTAGRMVVLPQGGGALVLTAEKAPDGTKWRFAPRAGGGWTALLKLPDGGGKQLLDVTAWGLAKDDASLIKTLAGK